MAILSLVFALLVAACRGGSEQKPVPVSGMPIQGGGLSVSEALASDLEGPLMVKGHIVARDGEVRFCEALLESLPPQCGGASVRLEGLDLAGLREQDGVRWSDDTVSVLGEIVKGTLTVSVNSR